MYKVGDFVKVKDNLLVGHYYHKYFCNDIMSKYRGMVAKVIRCIDSDTYSLDIDNGEWIWHNCMLEPMYTVEFGKTDKKENKMKADFRITDYKTYDNKVIVVTFEDGTKEKAVCSDMDEFDLERGVEVCTLKHLFGETEYKSMLRKSMKQIRDVNRAKEAKEKEETELAFRKMKADERKNRRREKRRQRRINDMKTAYLKALKEYEAEEKTYPLDCSPCIVPSDFVD